MSSKDYNKIHQEDVIKALKNDSFLKLTLNKKGTHFVNGICPNCGKKEVYISVTEPYRLACNRMDQCEWSQNTRDRYPELFEKLSEKYPVTPENPNASADAYLQYVRGFPLEKIKGLYKQSQIKIADSSIAEAVEFKLANGY